jgi:hypothetical protein
MIAETIGNVMSIFNLIWSTFILLIDLNYDFIMLIYKITIIFLNMIIYVFEIIKYWTKSVYNFVYNLLKISLQVEQYVKSLLQPFMIFPNIELTYGVDILDVLIVFSIFSSFLIIKFKLRKHLTQNLQLNESDDQSSIEIESNEDNNNSSLLNDSVYLCCICQVENSVIVFMPCKHLCTCESCYKNMRDSSHNDCPVCRAKIKNTIKVFV